MQPARSATSTPTNARAFVLRTIGAALTCMALSPGSRADPPLVAPEAISRLIETATAGKGRVEVRVGEIDPRVQLAPCARAEPFLPPGAKLWGRSAISIRCVSGSTWTVMLPVTVSVFGEALVARRMIAAGAPINADDFGTESIDLTRENATWVTQAGELTGKVASRTIAAGQPIRLDHLKVPPTVNSGDMVKVRVPGEGFSISTEGTALASAGTGQTVRIRMESGKVLTATVREGFVEIRP